MKQGETLPVEVVFHPNWWYKNYGIKFDKNFFFDPETRVQSDRMMHQYLFERFPDLGLGEQDARPRPVVGGALLAAGYIISGILGCEIRYCGNDMHKVRYEFAKLKKVSFFDVGWGSNVKLCREALPDRFLSLRLSPERMKSKTAEEIEKDIESLLQDSASLHKIGLCCINMDYGTPDENVRKIFEVADRYRNRI